MTSIGTNQNTRQGTPSEDTTQPPRPVAVIDVGTNSIRMAIAQISADGVVDTLESLSKPINLGLETFTKGSISRSTTEECVNILKDYLRVCQDYNIRKPDQMRVVGTSAVSEAGNRQAFHDRIYIATGLRVEPIAEEEVTRLTYLGLRPLLASHPTLADGRLLVAEIGGGNTEILLLESGNVAFSHTYRFGALRLRKTLESDRAGGGRLRTMMAADINRTIDQIQRNIPPDDGIEVVALGGDIRFAVSRLLPDADIDRVGTIPLTALIELVDTLIGLSPDEIVHRYHLTFPEAETVGPTLLAYQKMAQRYNQDQIQTAGTTLRDGLLTEMAVGGTWTEAFHDQIIGSALTLGRKFEFAEAHAVHTAKLSRVIFQALQDEHKLRPRHELLLYVAALLHDIGNVVNNRGHHKHSMYLILNSKLFGLGGKNLLMVALIARYHRRATPRPIHEGYVDLRDEDRITVAKLAAILRVADALDRSNSQRIDDIRCTREDNLFVISAPNVDDLSLEQFAVKQKGSFFRDIYGMQVHLRSI